MKSKFTDADKALLAKLWPTAVSDKRLEEVFGRRRNILQRCARETLGLPSRIVARDQVADQIIEQMRSAQG